METTGFEPSIIQDNRIQKLSKRLKRFTLEEISLIAELDESEVKPILISLISENFLIKHENNYIYNNIEKEAKLKKRLPKMFEYHPQETIDMIINCFCAEILPNKSGLILKPHESCICKFNLFFRQKLFEKQKEELILFFKKNPQAPRHRMFSDKEFYFYFYNNQVYVSDELFECCTTKSFTEAEEKVFKILYSYLTRRLNHNKMKKYIHLHIAEQIWRYKKEYKFLKEDLKKLIF